MVVFKNRILDSIIQASFGFQESSCKHQKLQYCKNNLTDDNFFAWAVRGSSVDGSIRWSIWIPTDLPSLTGRA
jgi:hypothetical protein